jgi:hypothetical protein
MDVPRLLSEYKELLSRKREAPRLIAGSASGPYRIEAFRRVLEPACSMAKFDVGVDGRVAVGDDEKLVAPLQVRDLRIYRD